MAARLEELPLHVTVTPMRRRHLRSVLRIEALVYPRPWSLGLCAAAAQRGCTGLTLEVRVTNTGAQALYRAFGFAPAGVRKNYYTETNEDAIVMWAHDIDLTAHRQRLDAIAASVPGTTTWEGVAR